MKNVLTIGTIVKLKNIDYQVVIIGFRGVDDRKEVRDYIGLIYPYGFINREDVLLFNTEDIEDITYIGYQSIEDEVFKKELYDNYYKESGDNN